MKNFRYILAPFFLISILLLNIFVINQKRNLDFIGLSFFIFFIFKTYKMLLIKKKSYYKKRFFLQRTLEDSLLLVLLINVTINIVHLYSYGFDVKIFRNAEYVQSLVFISILVISKFKSYKRYIPEFLLFYLLVPPGSATLVTSYLLYSPSVLTVLCIQFWIIYKKILPRQKTSISLLLAFSFPLIFLIFPLSGFLYSSWTLNLVEFSISNILTIVSGFLLGIVLVKENAKRQTFILLIIGFIIKLLIIDLLPSEFPTRGSVNNNLYAIAFEFFFFISLTYLVYSKKLAEKIFLFILTVLILLSIVNLHSRTSLFAVSFSFLFLICIYALKKYFPSAQNSLFPISLFSLFSIIFSSVYFILYINKSPSLMVRAKIWELALRGWSSSLMNFLIGIGDYNKINFLQYVKLSDIEEIKNLQEFGSGFFQMHIHNEFLAFGYGSGLLFLLFFILLALVPIYQLANKKNKSTISYGFGITIFCYLIHGLTEPIVSSSLTGFLFWFCYFSVIMNMNLEKIKLIEFQKKTFVILNLAAISLIIYFSIGNLLNRNLTQAILNYPQLRIIIREIEKPKPLSITQNELDLAIKKAEIKIKYFPTSIYEFVNLGDLITYSSIQSKNIALINRSEELYCQAFNLLPIPSFYNNLLNINKLTGKDFKEMCKSDKNISEKLIKYDIFGLVPSNFY